jgi:hypothetical protein
MCYGASPPRAARSRHGVLVPLIALMPADTGEGVAVPECRSDPRFAAQVAAKTGYVPYTMLVTPLVREGKTIGALSLLDRRDGGPYRHEDLHRAALFAALAAAARGRAPAPRAPPRGRRGAGARRRPGGTGGRSARGSGS